MSANVESMFYTGRNTPWHGLGIRVGDALSSEEAIIQSGLDWQVVQKDIKTDDSERISGFKANIRADNNVILGIVSDRYRVVQNKDAFNFTDDLLNDGVKYETAGSLNNGKRIWLLAKMPEKYTLADETVEPYMVFTNAHDGNGAVQVAMTPVRVVCQNTLNLALNTARRKWSTNHTGDIKGKLDEAKSTLMLADRYMTALKQKAEELSLVKLNDKKVMHYIDELIEMPDSPTSLQRANIEKKRNDIKTRYFEAPDLVLLPNNAWRFINAVSDHVTHSEPSRRTAKYNENLFSKTIDGLSLVDKALRMVA